LSETFLHKCERKYHEREAKRNAIHRIKNWTEEYQARRMAFYNAIPEEGTISENDHKALFPYGPSIHRDTKNDVLNGTYKNFIVFNKVNRTLARATERQEKLI